MSQPGQVAIYFHGVPGAPLEIDRFQATARESGVRLLALDRQLVDPDLKGEPYFEALAAEVARLTDGAPVHLIGFSLGAFVAIRTAVHLQIPVTGLHLISAAAPLESGDFLGQMAGRAVFKAAMQGPGPLKRLTRLQSWMAQWTPGLLVSLLFSSAAGADRRLASDRTFRAEIRDILRLSLEDGANGYTRELQAYVQPWQDRLAVVATAASLWHGSADSWAPAAMAVLLKERLPNASRLTLLDGRSHYSCLFDALPQVLFEIGARSPGTDT